MIDAIINFTNEVMSTDFISRGIIPFIRDIVAYFIIALVATITSAAASNMTKNNKIYKILAISTGCFTVITIITLLLSIFSIILIPIMHILVNLKFTILMLSSFSEFVSGLMSAGIFILLVFLLSNVILTIHDKVKN